MYFDGWRATISSPISLQVRDKEKNRGNGKTMACRGQLSRNPKELRILLCQAPPASVSPRAFVEKCHTDLKLQNPKFRVLIREYRGVEPQLWARHVQLSQSQITNNILRCSTSNFDSHVYASLLQNCVKYNQITTGKALHCHILKRGGCLDLFARNILLNFYVKHELLDAAAYLFNEMPERNMVSFVTLIQGFSQSEKYIEAVELFVRLRREGHELNPFVFTTTLKLLVNMEWAEFGWCVHACICKLGHDANAFVGTALIDAYSFCGFVTVAEEVFRGIVDKDMVSWTSMVACYAKNDFFQEALDLFSEMRMVGLKPNNFTFASVIKACLGLDAVIVGRCIHGCIIKTCYQIDHYVGVSLLDLYSSSGDIEDARQAFEEIPKDDVVPWSFMIARYSQSGHCEEALEMFFQMRKALVSPNQFTLASALQACATLEELEIGMQMHCHVLKAGLDLNVFVANALMDMYAKGGNMKDSVDLFLDLENKNDVSWNTLIVGYVLQGDGAKALNLFLNMLEQQIRATQVTYSSVLRACASMAALEPGIQTHGLTIKSLYDQDKAVSNALIDMYAKCGRIKDARMVFDAMRMQDVVSWNSMVSGYSMHGLGNEALEVFENMRNTEIKPNELTFVGVLSACSNTGSLEKGQAYFSLMQKEFGIEPCMEHYTCMVSLFGRLGHLDKAIRLIEEIQIAPSVMVWRSLLGACVVHNEVELGKIAADRVLDMEPQDEATYVLLSNMYATARSWDNVASVRKSMKKRRVKKEPGLSWIENQGTVHYFAVGDASHPDMKLIRGMLEWLNVKCFAAGYVSNSDVILLDVEDDEKTRLLWTHSERLALAFALIRTPTGSPIRIIKNLRSCMDCHAAIKFISNFVHREIVIRDINRFHHFQDGVCSCHDYW